VVGIVLREVAEAIDGGRVRTRTHVRPAWIAPREVAGGVSLALYKGPAEARLLADPAISSDFVLLG
jgi:hypothetical protein